MLTLRAEALQNAQVLGELVDGDEAIRLSSEIRRILAPIIAKGADRKPATQDLQSYIAQREGRAA
ncbi:hypothetical protein ABIF21_000156 [Bradyrhizobium elkanii]|nr:hypothetical protein [Bradyrhizobium elkanii]NWL37250.1 hypothetical protein [Bradyrhizobium elkanii]RYM19368.1 hypothetical protein EWH13_28840 [Bradyrhizobium elkanii]